MREFANQWVKEVIQNYKYKPKWLWIFFRLLSANCLGSLATSESYKL